MNFFNMLLNDPVVFMSFIGLGVLFGIAGFYVYYFAKKIKEDK
ncbi:DUF3149 domain-containing protein [Thalassotalea piscium]|uniref:DUF3149 domain-containing protein n=1 Tax=Thalassotalea piscium TaxID=1230533 RepID=A0A7X0TU85_9GAMM|nr:DUF3149 domain-containing protein [Thalassotalea piscium]MBB6543825.1 hypothetical protein [Thalassotalea piscium]